MILLTKKIYIPAISWLRQLAAKENIIFPESRGSTIFNKLLKEESKLSST